MAAVKDYALLSQAVYEADPQAKISEARKYWKCGAVHAKGGGPYSAFQGAVFRYGSDVVFAFKGTELKKGFGTLVGDGVADLKLGLGMNTHQFSLAQDFVLKHAPQGGFRVSLCGHSLGGAIAQIVGNRLRLPFVTFNAPGVGLMSRNLDEMAVALLLGTARLRTIGATVSAVRHWDQALQDIGSVFHVVQGVNFRLGKDVVGCIGVHYGKVIEIPYSGGALDVLTKHGIDEVIKHLPGSGYAAHRLADVV